MMAVIHHSFYLEFFFPFDQVWGWPRVVGSVLACFVIGGQQTCVEHVVDGPGQGERESVSDR